MVNFLRDTDIVTSFSANLLETTLTSLSSLCKISISKLSEILKFG